MKKTEQKVIKFILDNDLLNSGDAVLVSLSGGPDSVFLLHFLNKYKKKYKISVGALHLNHKLRGKEADADEKFCSQFCALLKIPFFSASADVKKLAKETKVSVEEAGRNARYDALTDYAVKNNYNKIATAHNANDNAETVLLNLIKGAGLKGISGIPVSRNNIIRPVMALPKEEIIRYLHNNSILFRIDKSNYSNDYSRNFLRNKIIPLIKELNPAFESTLLASSKVFRDHLQAIEDKILSESASFSSFVNNTLILSAGALKQKNAAESSEVIKLLVERNFYSQITFNDVFSVLSLLKKQTGASIYLSGRLIAARERDSIVISKTANSEKFKPIKVKAGQKVNLQHITFEINKHRMPPEALSNDRTIEYISADDLEEEFIIRRWINGDRFHPLGLKGTKKISDFLNEQKVLSSDKKNQLVLTNRGRIIWVLGLRIDDSVKIKKSTKKVYQLCLK